MRVTNLFKKLFRGEATAVFRGMATLMMGSSAAQLIGIGAIPVLTRLYSPEDFGVLAVYTAMITILAPLVTLRYALALPLPRQDGTALNLLALSAIFMFSGVVLVTLIFALMAGPLLDLLSMQTLKPWWWLIPLGVLAAASYELLTYWATRKRNYKVIAQTNIWQSLTGNLVKVGLGAYTVGPVGLLLGAVLAQGGGLTKLLRNFGKDIKSIPKSLSWWRLKKIAWGYRGYPYFRVPSQFFMAASQQTPLLFAATMYGSATTGQLSLAIMALAIPVKLLGGSMGRALYAEASSIGMSDLGKIYRITRDIQKTLFFISVPIGLVVFFFGEILFVFVFGGEWREAGKYASLLSLYLIFQFTSAPLIQLLNLVASQSVFFMINLIRMILLVVISIIFYVNDFDAILFVGSYSVVMAAFYLYVTAFVIRSIR
jgi:O-antigen/teichoic acid export membrane protein